MTVPVDPVHAESVDDDGVLEDAYTHELPDDDWDFYYNDPVQTAEGAQ